MVQLRISRHELETILDRTEAGESLSGLAREFPITRQAIAGHLKRRAAGTQLLLNSWEGQLSLPSNPADLAYIAGLLDAEGSIIQSPYMWTVRIANTNVPLMEWLGSFGGVVSYFDRSDQRLRCYIWSVNRKRDIVTLLEALLPHLRVKRAKAGAVLEAYYSNTWPKQANRS